MRLRRLEVCGWLFVCDVSRVVEVFLLRFALFFSLASALCLRGAGDAPVRGGTYFSLPRQRKVGKRKPLHTAPLDDCPRALNVPVLQTAAHWFVFVANASNQRLTHFNHP
jgi:hypothetical protein